VNLTFSIKNYKANKIVAFTSARHTDALFEVQFYGIEIEKENKIPKKYLEEFNINVKKILDEEKTILRV